MTIENPLDCCEHWPFDHKAGPGMPDACTKCPDGHPMHQRGAP